MSYLLPYYNVGVAMAAGTVIGLLQWGLLQKYGGLDSRWVWASMVAYGVPFLLFFVIGPDMTLPILMLLETASLGLLGLLQYAVLNDYSEHAVLWIIFNPVACLAGFLTSFILLAMLLGSKTPAGISWPLWGLFYGAITGVALTFVIVPMATEQSVAS